MNFWPPITWFDFIVMVFGIPLAIYLGYNFVRLIAYGVVKSYFDARREYYKKMRDLLDQEKNKTTK